MTQSNTPLSDLMAPIIAGGGQREVEAFHRVFLEAEVGVIVNGLPGGYSGWYRVGQHDRVSMPNFATADGRVVARACADPAVFAKRYDARINAFMRGRDVLEMVMKVSELDGALVCSAASVHSIVISRAEIPGLLAARPSPPKPQWWKFW